jgi:transcriptional regulator with XRE-family HTH domain
MKPKKKARTFVERLRQLVKESGMTQGEIARRAGVSPQVVSRLLASGNADVTLSVACRLAWAMGRSVSEFEEGVFQEWNMQPKAPELIGEDMSRGRLRQKLEATRKRIAEWKEVIPACTEDYAGQVTRRWMEGMIRHWNKQAQDLETRLKEWE